MIFYILEQKDTSMCNPSIYALTGYARERALDARIKELIHKIVDTGLTPDEKREYDCATIMRVRMMQIPVAQTRTRIKRALKKARSR